MSPRGEIATPGPQINRLLPLLSTHQVALIWIKRTSLPIPQALWVTMVTIAREVNMADTTKLSVEKALNKIREADARKAKADKLDEEIDALNEETKRLREQRVRLERHQRRST